MQPANPFARAAARRVADSLGLDASLLPVTAPPRPELGDFAVGCFPAAKARATSPARLAAEVAAAFTPDEHLAAATAAGPFVNFHANRAAAYRWLFSTTLGAAPADTPALIPTEIGAGKTICIDYSSPNISKHLAYHHIRSTVIGHALANLYRAVGYRVVGINHLGDWGTTHGMLLAAYKRWGGDEPLTITALNDLYVRFRQAMKEDPTLEADARAWFKRLEDNYGRDESDEAVRLWKLFRDVSWGEFQSVYDTLGITFEEVRGESAYLGDMQGVIDMLEAKGLTDVSDGALIVRSADDKTPPLLLRKQDGATLYATRDLAAAIYRWNTYHFERSLYVVDRGQGLHFRQLFDTLLRAGHDWAARCAHVPFGLVRLGGKKTGTRAGNVVLLAEVLREAADRAARVVREANPAMPDGDVARIASSVGVGAVVFANLASQREKDVDFEWDQILDLSGDSGPYIQYAHARCASLARKGAAMSPPVRASADATPAALTSDHEWALARKLLDVGDVVARAADANEPHHVCRYLLDLCALYSRWFTAGNTDRALRVLTDDPAVATARLTLATTTRHVLARGLALLGMDAPEAM